MSWSTYASGNKDKAVAKAVSQLAPQTYDDEKTKKVKADLAAALPTLAEPFIGGVSIEVVGHVSFPSGVGDSKIEIKTLNGFVG